MLAKFAVKNYRGFAKKIEWDLSKPSNYEFNPFAVKDGNENGKLYIHYPMLESLRCTEELPDEHYWQYTVGRDACDHFKNWTTTQYTYYKIMDFAVLPIDKRKGELRKDNWQLLKQQNVSKANYICTGNNEMPLKKEDIRQLAIFRNQVYNYVNTKECCVSILNAFPLFLYEYFKQ